MWTDTTNFTILKQFSMNPFGVQLQIPWWIGNTEMLWKENGSFWQKCSQFYNIKRNTLASVQYLEESRRLWKKEGRKLEGERINCFFTWMAHLMCTKYNIVVVDLDITISSEKRKVASWDVNEHMRFFHAPNNVHFFQLKNQSILKCIVIDRWKESSVTKTKLFFHWIGLFGLIPTMRTTAQPVSHMAHWCWNLDCFWKECSLAMVFFLTETDFHVNVCVLMLLKIDWIFSWKYFSPSETVAK